MLEMIVPVLFFFLFPLLRGMKPMNFPPLSTLSRPPPSLPFKLGKRRAAFFPHSLFPFFFFPSPRMIVSSKNRPFLRYSLFSLSWQNGKRLKKKSPSCLSFFSPPSTYVRRRSFILSPFPFFVAVLFLYSK